jgi:sterol desaturase/sphingolipid hydroxylase (fatty acid hydroxylase superfamily)
MVGFEGILKSILPYSVALTFVVIYAAEHIIPQRRDLIDHKHDLSNIFIGLFNVILAGVGGYYFQWFISFVNRAHFGLFEFSPLTFWAHTIIGFIMIDVFMYWWHRANHEINFLWKFHSFHHKDEKLNSTSAVRFHAVELVLSFVARFAIFPLMGFNVASILLHGLILFPVIVFHHSNISINRKADTFFRLFFVTPRMHRIHHSKIHVETNSNYGSIFPYWDSLFKSYTSKPLKEIEFGI